MVARMVEFWDCPTFSVQKPDGSWADVIGVGRDLLGMKVITWQDRTGSFGCMPWAEAKIRLCGSCAELKPRKAED